MIGFSQNDSSTSQLVHPIVSLYYPIDIDLKVNSHKLGFKN